MPYRRKKLTFAISSPDEFLLLYLSMFVVLAFFTVSMDYGLNETQMMMINKNSNG